MKNNGVKLLAATMVLVMAFAGAFLVIGSDESDAADTKVAKIVDSEGKYVEYGTLKEAIDGAKAGDTITLLGDCTMPTTINKVITIDGTTNKYKITLNDDVSVTTDETVTIKNVKIINIDKTVGDANEILVKGGSIALENVSFDGDEKVEYGMTLQESAVSGTFTNVDFNNKVLGNSPNGANLKTITLNNCEDARINLVTTEDKATVRIGTAVAEGVNLIMDKASATTTTLNFAADANNITFIFDLNGQDYTFKNITERRFAVHTNAALSIQNGTLTNTTFGTYVGDLDDPEPKKIERSSSIVFGDNVSLAGKTVVAKASATGEATDIVTIGGIVTLVSGSSIELQNTAKIDSIIVKSSDKISEVVFANLVAGDEGMTISDGSIIISGDYTEDENTGSIAVTGNATLLTSPDSSIEITVNNKAKLTVPEGVTVETIKSNSGIVAVYGSVRAISTNNGTVAVAPGVTAPAGVDADDVVSTSAVEDAFGMSKDLESDYTITSKAFLEKNLTIPEGITLTVNGNATLDLNGQTLTVLGTLVVKNNGVITTIANGTIEIGKNGKIDNSGIIGKEVPVKVKLQNDENNFVMVNNVIGLGFGMIKTVSGDDVAYAMSISGNVTKKGANAGGVTINGIVNVAGELSIGNGVTLSIANESTLNVTRNAVLDITSNGKLDYTGTGKVFMLPGATVTLNGESTALINAETGSFETTTVYGQGVKKLATVTVKVQSVKGLVLEVVSTSSYNEDLKKDVTEQRFLLSGEVKDANTTAGGALFQIRGDGTDATFTGNNDLKYKGVYVIDTLAIDKSMMAGTGEGKSDFGFYNSIQFTVLGTVTYNDDLNIGDGIADHLIGAIYSAESTDANGVKSITMYVKPFEAALASIDTAKDKTIDVYGPVEIGTEVKIASGQIIDGAATFNITENGKLTLENGANATANKFNVEGILVVMSDAGSIGTITYNAKITDAETGDVTYYGFQAALNNAKTGDVIEISKATTAQNVTIPEGVTVKIVTGGKLTVNKDLTVNGSLVNQAQVSVTGKTTVNGTMDISETGATTTMSEEVNVTGEIVTSSRLAETVKINAVYYQNDDMEFVYTTLDKALKGIADKDVQRYIYQVGKVSDSTDVTITNATLYIDGTASLGNLTIDSSRIVVQNNGELTANIIGKTGSETTTGATSEVTFSLSKVKTMNIENTSRANAQNVKVWYTSIASTDSNNYLVGNVTVKSGDLRLADDLNINNADNKMVVDGGLVVPENITLTVSSVKNGLTVNGNIDVIGFVSVSGIASVAGTMNIAKESASSVATVDVASTGTLKLSGSVTIVKDDTNGNGTMTVNGVLFVGTAAKTLGAAASVSGAVTIQSEGFIVAYDGADLTGAEINVVGNESQAKSTTFNINGQPYMTAYAMNSAVTYNDVLAKADIKLVGYDTTGIGSVVSTGTPAVQYWFSDADLTRSVSDAAIGNTENLYYKATALDVTFQISVGTGISMSIDGIKMTGNTYKLSVGTHSILAVVDPGYKGDVTISFNGQTVTNGQIVVTADMASASYDGLKVISATGNISTDAGSSGSAGSSSSDDGMSITDILLIVLVVLIVIMAVLVAIRMMRS